MHRFLLFGLLVPIAVTAQSYQVEWSVNGIGGGPTASAGYRANTTAGQTAIGRIGSSSFLALIGYWQSEAQVGVEEDEQLRPNSGRLVTTLCPPAPNPFARNTRVRYSLAAAAHVTLEVYDLTGRVRATLADAPHQPGRYETGWNGADNSGRLLANGVYFCRFRAGDHREIGKLMLAR